MNVILGLTGSVATVLYNKLIEGIKSVADIRVVLTPSAKHFVSEELNGAKIFDDFAEWHWGQDHNNTFTDKWYKGEQILHINLRDKASALVIAPCSANTLAKLANGMADNLLTSVARAWDFQRPLIIAPAMNTHMWNHPITKEHISKLQTWGCRIVFPQSKMLACGTEGMGAMAEIEDIVIILKNSLQWRFPLDYEDGCSGIPVEGHPGAFLCKRKMHTHTGVDLYTKNDAGVYAVEDCTIVGIEDFTGPKQNTPWWEDTQCVLAEGASGVVCYGEITPSRYLKIGKPMACGEFLGQVKRVLPLGKERPDIAGHSLSMLHIEVYPHGKYKAFEEQGPNPDKFNLLVDPTPMLIAARGAPKTLLK